MMIHVDFNIQNNKIVCKAKEINYEENITAMLVFFKYNDVEKLVSWGAYDNEKSFKEDLKKNLVNSTEEQIHEFYKNEEISKEQIKKRNICLLDIQNGTDIFWEEEKKYFKFKYPFETDQFDPELASRFLIIFGMKIKQKLKLFDKCIYNISYKDLDYVWQNKKVEFEEKLIKGLPRRNKIIINEKNI